ncbi:RacX Aspartate racemase [Rhabdaerophilaceae bacterium]
MMRKLGILGGMSWESSAVYYRLLNEGVRARAGGLSSARLVMSSVDFGELSAAMTAGRWDDVSAVLEREARGLEAAGAEAILIASNTIHKVAPAVKASTKVPLLHIADGLARAIKAKGCVSPLLLATRFTMEELFYREDLLQRHGITVRVPDQAGRDALHRIIFEELCLGVARPASKARALEIVNASGGDGVILGCTELMLMLSDADFSVPVFDTTVLHVADALDFLLPT